MKQFIWKPEGMFPVEHGSWLDILEVDAARAEDKRRIEQLESAIRWALGEEGEFPEEPPLVPGKYPRRYQWRTELRQRADLVATPPAREE